ncbi:PP0621 family protein [Rugamonas sp.]|uniref:PP0621 family protein n=1 Tax=Rugamonas sp. TaxID=1926287 RepID=UPI002600EB39|nr:PP0621 family protein [Rugamonas sp.]
MTRILFWLALVFLVVHAVRSKLREFQQPREPEPGPAAPTPTPSARQARADARAIAEAETMLCCAHCGIYYPASETVRSKGRDYCSVAHAALPTA